MKQIINLDWKIYKDKRIEELIAKKKKREKLGAKETTMGKKEERTWSL